MPPHLVKDDQSPVASSFRSPAMAFADRAVVMNGGRIEQIGMPRAKREPSPNQSVALVVPRGGLPLLSKVNILAFDWAPESYHIIPWFFAASAQPSGVVRRSRRALWVRPYKQAEASELIVVRIWC